jgi:hypothetical protein
MVMRHHAERQRVTAAQFMAASKQSHAPTPSENLHTNYFEPNPSQRLGLRLALLKPFPEA